MRIIECDSKLCNADDEIRKSKPIFEEVEGDNKDNQDDKDTQSSKLNGTLI